MIQMTKNMKAGTSCSSIAYNNSGWADYPLQKDAIESGPGWQRLVLNRARFFWAPFCWELKSKRSSGVEQTSPDIGKIDSEQVNLSKPFCAASSNLGLRANIIVPRAFMWSGLQVDLLAESKRAFSPVNSGVASNVFSFNILQAIDAVGK